MVTPQPARQGEQDASSHGEETKQAKELRIERTVGLNLSRQFLKLAYTALRRFSATT